jgi:hypothetical protein
LLSETERDTHLHIVGGTGKGKSKLIESMVRQDIIERRGLCLIDPHGQLYRWLTRWCGEHNLAATRNIVLLDPHMPDRVFGFNPLRVDGDISTHAEAMQAACAQVWGGENMHDMASLNLGLRAVFYMLAYHKLTLVEALMFLDATDLHDVRHRLTKSIQDPVYRAVWERYNQQAPRQFDEQLGSTYRRLFEFLDGPLVRAIVGQREHVIDFRKCMDEGAIVLVNLQKGGGLTEGKAHLLGTMIVNDLYQRAKARPDGSRPFTLYIDECYKFLNTDITSSLDETRKNGLRLVLAHQRLGQLEKEGRAEILNAVMSVQSKIVFGGLSVADAEHMAREIFTGEFNLKAAKKTFATPIVVGHEVEWLQSESESRGSSTTESESETLGTGQSESASTSDTQPYNNNWLLDPTQLRGNQSTTSGRTTFETQQHSISRAETVSQSVSDGRHQSRRPIMGMGPGPPKPLEELVHEATAKLKGLPARTAIAKPVGRRSVRFQVPTVLAAVADEKRVEAFVATVLDRSGFVAAFHAVTEEMAERLREVGATSLQALPVEEPTNFREAVSAPTKALAPRKRRAK